MRLELRTLLRRETLPVVLGGNTDVAVVRRLGVFVRHLQEDQVRELLEVIPIAHAIVLQDRAEPPYLRNDWCCGRRHAAVILFLLDDFVFLLSSPAASRSAQIRSSSAEAGSSAGFCFTSRPENALRRTDWRSASARRNSLSICS